MKIALLSDLHLEFGPYNEPLPDADLLVLAGDIFVVRDLRSSPYIKERVRHFLQRCNNKYKTVLLVMGNHEHYHGNIVHSKRRIQQFLEDNKLNNIKLRENQFWDICTNQGRYSTYFDERIFCATLWTDFDRGDFPAMLSAKLYMNDFRLILNNNVPFTPEAASKLHAKSLEELLKADPTIVVSHHLPSPRSIDPDYRNETLLNHAYYTDLTDLIIDSKIKLWLHGHVHCTNDYMIGNCRVVSNPRGYVGHAVNPTFNPGLVLDVTV